MPKAKAFDRKEVLADLTGLFQQKGYNGTSIQDIVRHSKLSRSSIYDTFVSKDGLFLEVLKTYLSDFGKLVNKVVKDATNPFDAIKGIFDLSIDVVVKSDKDNSGCLFVNSKAEIWCEEKIVGNSMSNSENGLFQLFENLVQDGQNQGIISMNRVPSDFARYLVTSLHGFRLTGISNQNRKELVELADIILSPLQIE